MAELLGNEKDRRKWVSMAEEMKKRVNEETWDGEWYMRAFDDDGNVVGSSNCKEGKIWVESNSWAVLSGVAGERAIKTLESIKKHLYTKFGIVLFTPPFTEYHPELGYVSVFPAGLKENASIFCHTNPWVMCAEAMLGHGDQAFQYWKTIAPAANNDLADIHWTEPYVYSQMIAGRDHKDFGQAKNSWLTGTAAWNFVAISQYILGIRPDFDGLIVDPCIPKDWSGFTVRRWWREALYIITVKNSEGINKGIKKMSVDGKIIEGNKAPVFRDGREHILEAVMGSH